MEARNRKIEDWYGKVKRGEIKLPRFQRFEAWDRHRICSLLETVIHNLPLGITLGNRRNSYPDFSKQRQQKTDDPMNIYWTGNRD